MVAGFHTGDQRRGGDRLTADQIICTMATDSTRRLHHHTPSWISSGAVFHIRGRVTSVNPHLLTEPRVARALLESAKYYHETGAWFCHLLLLMPDHWHALLSFPPDAKMIVVIGRWKAWQKRTQGILWQDNFFDHRIRYDREFQLKADYIRQNPVVKGLCMKPEEWPWAIAFDLNRA